MYCKKAQAGFELIILLGMFFAIVSGVGLYVTFELSKNIDRNELEAVSREISYTADSVSSLGPGSFRVIQVRMPKDILQIYPSFNSIELRKGAAFSQEQFSFPSNTYMYGFLDNLRGENFILMKRESRGYVSVTPLGYPNLTDGLIGMYNFDSTDGTSILSATNVDDVCYKSNVTYSGNIVQAEGHLGHAMFFNGLNNDSINCSNKYDFERNSFSIGAWFKTNGTYVIAEKRIISNGHFGWSDGYLISADSTGIIAGIGSNGSNNQSIYVWGNTQVDDYLWHQVTMTFDSENDLFKVYIDGSVETLTKIANSCGVLIDSSTAINTSTCGLLNASSINDLDAFMIGSWKRDDVYGLPFYGYIDEVVIYNRTLTDNEIFGLYSLGR